MNKKSISLFIGVFIAFFILMAVFMESYMDSPHKGIDINISFKKENPENFNQLHKPVSEVIIRGVKNLDDNGATNVFLDKSDEEHIKTDVLFVDENLEIDNATVTLAKYGDVSSILHCNNFDVKTYKCDKWEETDIPFKEHDSYITFVVKHFTAYAGGLAGSSENSSLAIWDETDTSMPYGDQIIYADNPVILYANYTNQSLSINGTDIYCNVTFNDTAAEDNTTMLFNDSILLYQFNRTFDSKGTYTFNVSCNDTVTGYDGLNASDIINITNTAPVVSKDAQNKLPALTCSEDSVCSYNFSQNVTDADDTDVLNYTSNAQDLGFTVFSMDKNTGFVNFTAQTDSQTGTYDVTLIATDNDGSSDSASKQFIVNAANDVPAVSTSNLSSSEAVLYFYNVSADTTDEENNTPYVFGSNATFFNITEDGLINFTPNRADVGNYTINISVNDSGGAEASIIIEFQVNYTNNLPSFDYVCDNERNTTENSIFSCVINGTDPDNDIFNFSSNTSWFEMNTSGFVDFTPTDIAVGDDITINISVDDNSGGLNWTLINFSVANINDLPSIYFPGQLNATEGRAFNFTINATDNDTLTTFGENLTYWSNATIFNISTEGVINFTPNSGDAGNYSINISVNDSQDAIDSMLINFSVIYNSPPSIDEIAPYGEPVSNTTVTNLTNSSLFTDNITSLSITETESILFNQSSSDSDDDTITYEWYFNGTLNNTNSSWTYSTEYYDAGEKNVTLTISDGGFTTSFTWNVTVGDNNREPLFGVIRHSNSSDFDGTNNNTNSTGQLGNVTLLYNGSHYPSNGTFTSIIINLNSPAKDTTLTASNIKWFNISWNADLPDGTNITFQTRTSSDGVTFTNYSSDYTNSSGEEISSPADVYIQYRADLTTTNISVTPVLENVTIDYGIGDITFNENDVQENWIDLDYFFSDLDLDTNLTYNYTNVTDINITIKSDNVVKLDPTVNTYGIKYVVFSAFDGTNTTYSNNITLNVSHVSTPTTTVYSTVTSGGGGGSSVTIVTELKNLTKLESINLVEPGAIELISPTELEIDIKLINKRVETFKGITLLAYANISTITLNFKRNYFNELPPNSEARTDLVIRSEEPLQDSFILWIEANVTQPDYVDRAVLTVSPLLEEAKKTLLFVKDLLTTNPECLELNEQLGEIGRYIDEGKYRQAHTLLDSLIESCRYLISSEEKTIGGMLSPLRKNVFSFLNNRVSRVLIILFLILIVTIIVMHRQYKKLE